MLSDEWIGRECNAAVAEAALTWLLRQEADDAGAAGSGVGGGAVSQRDPHDAAGRAAVTVVAPRAADDPEALAIRRALSQVTASQRAVDAAWAALAPPTLLSGAGAGPVSSASGGGGGGGGGGRARRRAPLPPPPLAPDVTALAQPLRPCLQRPEPLPPDLPSLFETRLYGVSADAIPLAVALFERLGVAHARLSLIPPQFEAPLPRLRLAVFPPAFPEPPPPPLECFDLDSEWATVAERLAATAAAAADGVAEGDLAPGGDGELELAAYLHNVGHVCGISVVRARARHARRSAGAPPVCAAGRGRCQWRAGPTAPPSRARYLRMSSARVHARVAAASPTRVHARGAHTRPLTPAAAAIACPRRAPDAHPPPRPRRAPTHACSRHPRPSRTARRLCSRPLSRRCCAGACSSRLTTTTTSRPRR